MTKPLSTSCCPAHTWHIENNTVLLPYLHMHPVHTCYDKTNTPDIFLLGCWEVRLTQNDVRPSVLGADCVSIASEASLLLQQLNNNNNGYFECLTHTGPRLKIYNTHSYTHHNTTHTYTPHTHAHTYTHTHTRTHACKHTCTHIHTHTHTHTHTHSHGSGQ